MNSRDKAKRLLDESLDYHLDNKVSQWDQMSDVEQQDLVGLYMMSEYDPEIGLSENNRSREIALALADLMHMPSKEKEHDFLEMLKETVANHYSDVIDHLFAARAEKHFNDYLADNPKEAYKSEPEYHYGTPKTL